MVRGANVRPIRGRQDPGGPHVGPMNFAIWACIVFVLSNDIEDQCIFHLAQMFSAWSIKEFEIIHFRNLQKTILIILFEIVSVVGMDVFCQHI